MRFRDTLFSDKLRGSQRGRSKQCWICAWRCKNANQNGQSWHQFSWSKTSSELRPQNSIVLNLVVLELCCSIFKPCCTSCDSHIHVWTVWTNLHSLNMSMCQHDKDPQESSRRGCLLFTQPTLCTSPFWPLCFDSWLTHLYIDCLHLVLQYGCLMSAFPHQMCVAPDFHVCIWLLSPCLAAY